MLRNLRWRTLSTSIYMWSYILSSGKIIFIGLKCGCCMKCASFVFENSTEENAIKHLLPPWPSSGQVWYSKEYWLFRILIGYLLLLFLRYKTGFQRDAALYRQHTCLLAIRGCFWSDKYRNNPKMISPSLMTCTAVWYLTVPCLFYINCMKTLTVI